MLAECMRNQKLSKSQAWLCGERGVACAHGLQCDLRLISWPSRRVMQHNSENLMSLLCGYNL